MKFDNIAGTLSSAATKVSVVTGAVSSVSKFLDGFGSGSSTHRPIAGSLNSLRDAIRKSSKTNMFAVLLQTDAELHVVNQFQITATTIPGLEFNKITYSDLGRQFHMAGSSTKYNDWTVTIRTGDYSDYLKLIEWHNSINNQKTGDRRSVMNYKTTCFVKPLWPNSGADTSNTLHMISMKLNGVFPTAVSDIEYDVTNSDLSEFTVTFSIDSIEYVEITTYKTGSHPDPTTTREESLLGTITDTVRDISNTISTGSQAMQTLKGFIK